jgi:hypothetical protein
LVLLFLVVLLVVVVFAMTSFPQDPSLWGSVGRSCNPEDHVGLETG